MKSQLKLKEYVEVFSNTNTCDAQIKQLIQACQNKQLRSLALKFFLHHPLLKMHDVARALYLLLALEEGIDLGIKFLDIHQEDSGAVRLFRNGGFPWKGLPYPAEHAELGLLLLQIAEFYEEAHSCALKMSAFQQHCFTHEDTIFPALWSQEYTRSLKEKNILSKSLLHQTVSQIINPHSFCDQTLGFWMRRTNAISAFVAGSGCKSGVGGYYVGDVGIINYGPCVGDPCSELGFGISGSVKDFVCLESENKESVELTFLSCLSIPHHRSSGFSYLYDVLLGPRVRHQIQISDAKCQIRSVLQESSSGTSFSLFCKGKSCHILGGPRLRAGSFDSYKGPVYKIIVQGARDAISIRVSGSKMKIISLQNEKCFWGSQFLVNIPYDDREVFVIIERL